MNHSTVNNSVILVPTYRVIEPETEESLRKLELLGWKVERRFGMPAIDGARAIMATWAITRGYEWLYWIDADMQFDVADFLRLVEWHEPLCCVPYAIKGSGGMVSARAGHILDHATVGIIELEAVGFGFMKNHCSVYLKMAEQLPVCQQTNGSIERMIPFFQPRWWKEEDGRNVYYGEDYSFCLHARQLGFKLLANFDIEIGHIGRWAFRIRDPL